MKLLRDSSVVFLLLDHKVLITCGIASDYDDPAASVNAAIRKLDCLEPVQEEDYQGLWNMIDAVEACWSQLTTIHQIQCLSLRDVDYLSNLLPPSFRVSWHEKYHMLGVAEQIQPFQAFMVFLLEKRQIISRMVELSRAGNCDSVVSPTRNGGVPCTTHSSSQSFQGNNGCAVHGLEDVGHCTASCGVFQELSRSEKFEKLRHVKACFRCFDSHLRSECEVRDPCDICGKTGHHTLLCMDA